MQLGLGTWGFCGEQTCGTVRLGWPELPVEAKSEILRTAVRAGIEIIDTSDFYGCGAVEELIGSVVGPVNGVRIFTKAGLINSYDELNGEIRRDFSSQHLRQAIDGSRKRLTRTSLDLLQLHGPDLHHLRDPTLWRFLEGALSEGAIRAVGVSVRTRSMTTDYAKELVSNPLISAIQIPVSLVDLDFRDFAIEFRTQGKLVIGRSPFKHGLLLKNRPDDLAVNDQRRDFIDNALRQRLVVAQGHIDDLARQRGVSRPHAILMELAERQICDIVLCGASSTAQVLANVNCMQSFDRNQN